MTVNEVGGMLLARVDLIVVNVFFGAAMTGGYGSVAQFSLLMSYLVSAAGTVVRPIILIKYAQCDFAGLQRLSSQYIKLLGLALALPIGVSGIGNKGGKDTAKSGIADDLFAAWGHNSRR